MMAMKTWRQRGSALFVAMVVIGLVGVWGMAWIRSLRTLRRDADVRRMHEAGRDLAESAIARGRAALAQRQPVPTDAWKGELGTAVVSATTRGDTVTLVGTATIAVPGTRVPPLEGVVVGGHREIGFAELQPGPAEIETGGQVVRVGRHGGLQLADRVLAPSVPQRARRFLAVVAHAGARLAHPREVRVVESDRDDLAPGRGGASIQRSVKKRSTMSASFGEKPR